LLSSADLGAADFTTYHSYDQLTSALREMVAPRSRIASLVEVGKSGQGRTIWAVEIANRSGSPVESRPALLVAAGFEGDQLIGSELALCVIHHILSSYETNPEVKQQVDTRAFYILPRINVDAAEGMFAVPRTGQKTNRTPSDDDNDGRVDEDGPEDLNGDGVISIMRARDPHGDCMLHPDEPRLLRKADPRKGEAGTYSLYTEGIDNDGDGFINEDPPGGVDLNRNFQHRYPYYAPDAGRHMVSEPETRALLDYVLRHRNIGAILTFGESDNLVAAPNRRGELGPAAVIDMLVLARRSSSEARAAGTFQIEAPSSFPFGPRFGPDDEGASPRQPPGSRRPARRPAEVVNPDDLEYFRAVSEKYRAVTGIRSAAATRPPAGAFFEYGYYQFGVPSFSTPGWGLPADERPEAAGGRPGPRAGEEAAGGPPGQTGSLGPPVGTAAFDLRLLKWMDAEKVDGFADWAAFTHPQLGDIEIGGFLPYACVNPPASRIADLGRGHSEFILHLASLLPRVAVASTSVAPLGDGLFRIKAEIENAGFLPTASAHGVTSRSVKPTMVQLGIEPSDLVSGDAKTSFFPKLDGSGRRQRYEWIVRGKTGASISLKVLSQKGGTIETTVTLK
jgi:hypothetical protein